MSKNQFEQLIEYVINDEDAKAKELFHQIVVSKSRQIYENLMQEDNAMGMEPTEIDTNVDEGDDMMGGSQSGDMIDDVEAEESGMQEAEDDESDSEFDDGAEEAGDDLTHDIESEHDMEDDEAASKSDVMDLSDKLDELMAQFEDMMGGGDMGDDAGMGDDGMDAEEVDFDEFETEGMMENISLKQVHPKVTTHEEGDGKAGPVAFNAGQTGMEGRPVRAGKNEGGHHDTAAYKNSTKDLIGKVGNTPAQAKQDLKPATKPHLGQASGVNTRTPFPRGGK
jgi:hypothetical protein